MPGSRLRGNNGKSLLLVIPVATGIQYSWQREPPVASQRNPTTAENKNQICNIKGILLAMLDSRPRPHPRFHGDMLS